MTPPDYADEPVLEMEARPALERVLIERTEVAQRAFTLGREPGLKDVPFA